MWANAIRSVTQVIADLHRVADSGNWNEEDLQFNLTWHQRVTEPDEFHSWFFHGEDLEGQERERIPERVRDAF